MNAWIMIVSLLLYTSAGNSQIIRFAVIGDYGIAGQPEADVSTLVKSWNPDFIITLGDNNYEQGAASMIDLNIGQYYHEFIFPYTGIYGSGDTINRFFPSLGNHDWNSAGAIPYLNHFTLPGNERYYDFTRGPVHFFVLDSDSREPDGNSGTSLQAQWLQSKLETSDSRWKIAYFHHPPYSSGTRHGSSTIMRWPFRQLGIDVVLAGHEHLYERIVSDSILYIVNGLGGKEIYTFGNPIAGSQFRYNGNFGAMLVETDSISMRFRFYSRASALIDYYELPSGDSCTMRVSAGWNIVSLPEHPQNASKTNLFPQALSPAYRFESGNYVESDTLTPGTGYWMKFNLSECIAFGGTPFAEDTIDIQVGWNLIGSIPTPLPTSGIIQLPENMLSSSFYRFNAGYIATDTLRPGAGYWIKSNQEGKLILESSTRQR